MKGRRLILFLVLISVFVLPTGMTRADFFSYAPLPGWFWYRDVKEIVKDIEDEAKEVKKEEKKEEGKKEKTAEAKKPPDEKYEKDPRWAHLPVTPDAPEPVKKLLYKPTLENAKAYLKWLWDVNERASVVADLIQRAYVEEGDILYPDKSPRTQLASYVSRLEKERADKVLTEKAASSIGLFYFYKNGCPACEVQHGIIKHLKDRGFTILGVSVDGNPEDIGIGIKSRPDNGFSQLFGVREVPTLVAVTNRTKSFRIIARGVTTLDIILERIFNFFNEEVENVKEVS